MRKQRHDLIGFERQQDEPLGRLVEQQDQERKPEPMFQIDTIR